LLNVFPLPAQEPVNPLWNPAEPLIESPDSLELRWNPDLPSLSQNQRPDPPHDQSLLISPRENSLPPFAENGEDTFPGDGKKAADIYLRGHLAMKEGFEKERKGDFGGAYGKLREARELFDAVGEADPAWQQEMVEYRRRKTREELERVRHLEIQRRTAGPETAANPEIQRRPDAGREEGAEIHELQQRLRRAEQALGAARQREARLRAVLRDLLEPPPGRPMAPMAPPSPGPRPELPPAPRDHALPSVPPAPPFPLPPPAPAPEH